MAVNVQAIFSVVIFVLLSSQDGFSTSTGPDGRKPALYNGIFSTIAFLVANLWNFQLNRWWTFKSSQHAGWWKEYVPFLAVGLLALIANLGILTLLLHPGSPVSLPTSRASSAA